MFLSANNGRGFLAQIISVNEWIIVQIKQNQSEVIFQNKNVSTD